MLCSKNKIALVDCNSFYVSCERLFNTSIIKKPVIVLSSNDGCVISRSTEAKTLGIKMGEPYFKVKKIVKENNVKIFSSNYSLYGDISRRVMKTLKQFSPKIEIYSIDEAFLDLSSIKDKDLLEYGSIIRKTILKWTGIPTSIGIATTKTLSKIANHVAKKDSLGVINLINTQQIDKILKKIKINDVWGVGRQLTKFYIKNGINTAYQLKKMPDAWIKKNTNVFGGRTVMELKGLSCISLETYQEKRKNCCVSRSFGRKVTKLEELNESVTTHCLNAAEKIRLDNQTTKKITVFIRTSPFQKDKNYYVNSKDIDLPIRTNDSIELVKQALIALKYIYKKGYKYQKVGIIFSALSDVGIYKKNLFSLINSEEKRKKLMKAIDYTNNKYGRNALSIAHAGLKKKWNIKRQHYSKIDTACFDFLPIVKIA
ncbi:MAG: Y-family DNA polymerase [Pelagibacteraceae bacterium]|jgi:DNA polymerase V|nr:Y-family DNA polymerase [Pelagibacteraceae bacterium]|tara:strand:+ start:148 stop:1428 length:1281 start_codon:yes stop_codon:yes gene_type:complete